MAPTRPPRRQRQSAPPPPSSTPRGCWPACMRGRFMRVRRSAELMSVRCCAGMLGAVATACPPGTAVLSRVAVRCTAAAHAPCCSPVPRRPGGGAAVLYGVSRSWKGTCQARWGRRQLHAGGRLLHPCGSSWLPGLSPAVCHTLFLSSPAVCCPATPPAPSPTSLPPAVAPRQARRIPCTSGGWTTMEARPLRPLLGRCVELC